MQQVHFFQNGGSGTINQQANSNELKTTLMQGMYSRRVIHPLSSLVKGRPMRWHAQAHRLN